MPLHPLNDDQISLLEEYKSSNLSLVEFAESKGKSKHSIYYLIDKERKLKAESLSLEVRASENFIPVPLKSDMSVKNENNNKNISFKLSGLTIQIDNKNLKLFLEALSHDWSK